MGALVAAGGEAQAIEHAGTSRSAFSDSSAKFEAAHEAFPWTVSGTPSRFGNGIAHHHRIVGLDLAARHRDVLSLLVYIDPDLRGLGRERQPRAFVAREPP